MSVQEGSPDFVVPDAIEPIVGWKAWRPHYSGQLLSPSTRDPWIPREPMVATCSPRIGPKFHFDIPSPLEECTCGIYISSEPHTAFAYGPVLGKVKGWGKVIKHAVGWRVQYAYPLEIYSVFSEDLGFDRYGVPVHRIDPVELKKIVLGEAKIESNLWYIASLSKIFESGFMGDVS